MARSDTHIRQHLKVKPCIAPETIHEAEKLQRELILTEIITIFENEVKVIATPVAILKDHIERQLLRSEHFTLLHTNPTTA
jgi:hypothetical protein